MDNDEELDRLEALAENVDQQLPSSSGSSWSRGSEPTASESESEDNADLAAAAASIPRKRRHSQAAAASEPVRNENDEEEDAVLKGASWRDMEDARRFLTADHMERLSGLINRWEHGNIEEGDDVDLNTGLIVRSTGHLQALAPQTDMALFDDEEDESEEDEDLGADSEIPRADSLVDPLFTVCQRPAKLLNAVVEMSRQRWML